MGAESFFVKFLPKGISRIPIENDYESYGYAGESEVFLLQLIENFTVYNIKCVPRSQYEFIINDSLILTVHSEESKVREISIEGCFSWFEECINEIYKLSMIIYSHIVRIELYHPQIDRELKSLDVKEFCEIISGLYKEKYEDYMKLYGVRGVVCLPREGFYNYVGRQNKKINKENIQ